MSTEDVIELGSSEEEVEPAPKKRKATPTAMAVIPSEQSEVNIKVTKIRSLKNINMKPKPVTTKNIYNMKNNNTNIINDTNILKQRSNFISGVNIPVIKKLSNDTKYSVLHPLKMAINPMAMRKLQKLSIPKSNAKNKKNPPMVRGPKVINNLPPGITVKPVSSVKSYTCASGKMIKQIINKPKSLVPQCSAVEIDDESVEATVSPQWYLRPEEQGNSTLNGKEGSAVLEELEDKTSMLIEEQNNKEPDTSNFIEIVIEDSPVKQSQLKHCNELGTELPITIDDSPVKPILKTNKDIHSDSETCEAKTPFSKKKLEYPKENDKEKEEVGLEIDIMKTNTYNCNDNVKEDVICANQLNIEKSPIEVNSDSNTSSDVNINDKQTTSSNEFHPIFQNFNELGTELPITIDDCPVKPILKTNKEIHSDSETCEAKTPFSKKKLEYPKENDKEKEEVGLEIDIMKTNTYNCNDNVKEDVICTNQLNIEKSPIEVNSDSNTSSDVNINDKQTTSSNEFHPIFQNFIDSCYKLDQTAEMTKVVERKLKPYYKKCTKEYVESEEFIELVSSKIISMKAKPVDVYLFIKDIVDELDVQRRIDKSFVVKENDLTKDLMNCESPVESEYYDKTQRQIRKLENTIKKCCKYVQDLEDAEVNFEDDASSAYLLSDRYKARIVQAHKKLCKLTKIRMPSEPHIHIETRPGRPLGPAKKLEKWINKKVPIGSPLPFPDFHDVLRCVREANREDRLGWNEIDIMEEARDLFVRCGKKLQRRRQENEWKLAYLTIGLQPDPADSNEDLKKKIEENEKIAASKEAELFNKFVDKQNQMNLKPVEIADKEADESPVESEEEDFIGEKNFMSNEKKRKVALKRILKERSKKFGKKKKMRPLEYEEGDETKLAESKTTKTEATTKDNESVIMDANEISENEPNDLNEAKKDKFEVDQVKDSDDDVGSGVDELNLLSKLYSENEMDSSQNGSDSDASVITLSTIETDSDNENDPQVMSEDVISIEDSSYSESEFTMYNAQIFSKDMKDITDETEFSLNGNTEKDAGQVVIADILLASSEEENSNPVKKNDYLNLKADSLSEKVVASDTCDKENVGNEHSSVDINENALLNKSESTLSGIDIDDKCVNENSATSSIISIQNNENEVDEVKENVDAISVENVDSQIEETVQKGSPKEILNDNTIVSTIEQENEKDNKYVYNSNQSVSTINDE